MKPKTTDGIPASRSTTDSTAAFNFLGANLARYAEVKKPTGKPKIIAPTVPYTEVRINGMIPKYGSDAVDAHLVPKIKSVKPILKMAGTPLISRYKQITATKTMFS